MTPEFLADPQPAVAVAVQAAVAVQVAVAEDPRARQVEVVRLASPARR